MRVINTQSNPSRTLEDVISQFIGMRKTKKTEWLIEFAVESYARDEHEANLIMRSRDIEEINRMMHDIESDGFCALELTIDGEYYGWIFDEQVPYK